MTTAAQVSSTPASVVDRPSRTWRWVNRVPKLWVFAALPMIPFVVLFGRVVAVRSQVFLNSDSAIVNVMARQALGWHQQLGIYDRFGWHHPGPSYFYLIATFERILGSNSGAQAQMAAVIAVNAICVLISILVVGRRWGTRPAAAVALSLTALSVGMSGPISQPGGAPGTALLDNVWTPYVGIFPLILAGVLTAVAIDGSIAALLGAAVASSYAAQADVAMAGLAALFIVAGLAGCAFTCWKRRRPSRGDLQIAVPLGVLLVIMWVPPIIEEFSGSPGNLTALWRFFVDEHHPKLGLLQGAVQVGNNAVSAFGVRSRTIQLAQEPGLRQFYLVAGGGLVVVAAAVWARLWSAATLAVLGVAGLAAAVYSADSIVGFPTAEFTTWSAAPTALLVVSATMLVVSRLPSSASGRWAPAWPWPDLVLAALVVVASAGLLVRTATFPPLRSSASAPQLWRLVAPVVAAHPHERVGLANSDTFSLPGIVDQLDARGIPYSVPAGLRVDFPPGHSAQPQYWIYIGGTLPGYRVIGSVVPVNDVPQLIVSVGQAPPPGWSEIPPVGSF